MRDAAMAPRGRLGVTQSSQSRLECDTPGPHLPGRDEKLIERKEMSRLAIALCALLLGSLPAVAAAQQVQIDAGVPAYTNVSGVSGSLSSVGSDTLNNLMTLWSEGFRKTYPSVRIQVEGKGSSTAPPALVEGTAQFGPMSREMKASEIQAFEARYGYPPTQVRVAVDALAVYVHRDNPLAQLTMAQVDAIFSKNRLCGAPAALSTWGALGVQGPLAARPIRLYGRNSASGTYGYFKQVALCEGDFADQVKEQPGSASVVQGIAGDPYGIGYSGIGYRTSGVKALALAKAEGQRAATTATEDVYSGRYPLSRYLYIYVNRKPGQPLDALRREFLRFVLSRPGQEVVVKDGYLPLHAEAVAQELAKLQ
jgi:phosphate transport system substrate-binding protein